MPVDRSRPFQRRMWKIRLLPDEVKVKAGDFSLLLPIQRIHESVERDSVLKGERVGRIEEMVGFFIDLSADRKER